MVEQLTPEQFAARRAAGELWQLLDVREPWEIDTAAVDHTDAIPMAELETRYPELDAAMPVAVLCHSGGRSAMAAAFLEQRGFRRVANIAGGIDAWSLTVDPSIPRY